MRTLGRFTALVAASFFLAGCSLGSLLNGKEPAANVPVAVGNDLSMPPSLALPQPGSGTADTFASSADAGGEDLALDAPGAPAKAKAAPAVANAKPISIFEQYGISETHPNGKKKTGAELQQELKLAILRKKRQTNPNYGTIRNIGSIFSDG